MLLVDVGGVASCGWFVLREGSSGADAHDDFEVGVEGVVYFSLCSEDVVSVVVLGGVHIVSVCRDKGISV